MLSDDRAQSIQIGAILLFGVLILGLAIAQTVVVPAENKQVEFNGYIETTEDLVTLRNDILTAGTQGSEQAEAVKTGVRYPSRAVLINPGPPVGSLRTNESGNVTISGGMLVSGEESNARGYWNNTSHDYQTKTVRFAPAYNNIDVPPIEVSSTGAYRTTDNGPITLAGGTFISGNRITIVTVEGNLSTSSLTTSVGVTPKSVATRSVTLERNDSAANLNLTVPVPGDGSQAAAEAWLDSSAADSLQNGNNAVESLSINDSDSDDVRVDITLDDSRTFELRLANVVVHDAGDSGINTDIGAKYLVATEGNGSAIPTTGTRRVAVEARDRYNNPVEGVNVSFSTGAGNFSSTGTGEAAVLTDSEGRAAVFVDPNQSSVNIAASFDGGVTPYNETTITLTEPATGGVDAINDPSGGVVLGASGIQSSSDKDVVLVSFNNTGPSDKNITEMRIAFYNPDGGSDNSPSEVVVENDDTLGVGDRFKTLNSSITLESGTSDSTQVEFDFNSPAPDARGDFFIISVAYEKGNRATFFVNVHK